MISSAGGDSTPLSPNERECLDGGLRILARMIAAAYKRRHAAVSQKNQETAVNGGAPEAPVG